MIFHIAVCAGDPALRAVLRRHCEDYFARRATGCAVAALTARRPCWSRTPPAGGTSCI